MNREAAILFLKTHAKMNHMINFTSPSAPSHGDPGRYSTIRSACSCVTHNGYSILDVDEAKPCDCGARQHNLMVDEAINALTS